MNFERPFPTVTCSESMVQRFPVKLLRILNTCTNGAIKWGEDGCSVNIKRREFEATFLKSDKKPFQTESFSSFIRQLNLYGFQKLPQKDTGNENLFVYRHSEFRRDSPDLSKIQRKSKPTQKRNKDYHAVFSRILNPPIRQDSCKQMIQWFTSSRRPLQQLNVNKMEATSASNVLAPASAPRIYTYIDSTEGNLPVQVLDHINNQHVIYVQNENSRSHKETPSKQWELSKVVTSANTVENPDIPTVVYLSSTESNHQMETASRARENQFQTSSVGPFQQSGKKAQIFPDGADFVSIGEPNCTEVIPMKLSDQKISYLQMLMDPSLPTSHDVHHNIDLIRYPHTTYDKENMSSNHRNSTSDCNQMANANIDFTRPTDTILDCATGMSCRQKEGNACYIHNSTTNLQIDGAMESIDCRNRLYRSKMENIKTPQSENDHHSKSRNQFQLEIPSSTYIHNLDIESKSALLKRKHDNARKRVTVVAKDNMEMKAYPMEIGVDGQISINVPIHIPQSNTVKNVSLMLMQQHTPHQ